MILFNYKLVKPVINVLIEEVIDEQAQGDFDNEKELREEPQNRNVGAADDAIRVVGEARVEGRVAPDSHHDE